MVMLSQIELTILSAFIYATFAEVLVNRYSRMVRVKEELANKTRYAREDIYLPAVSSDDQCVDKMKGCHNYVAYCESHKQSLQGRCDKTCRYCGPTACEDVRPDCGSLLYFCPALKGACDKTCGRCGPPKCMDKRSDCKHLKQYCKSHEQRMKVVCEKTCGYCVGCNDEFTPEHCAMLKRLDKCHADLRMQDYCRHTCGFCKLPEPASCWKSEFGCCWDKLTAKTSPDGRNCPSCNDKFKRLCRTLKKACISSSFVRNNCHHSCNYCPENGTLCNDDPEKIHLCKFWSEKFNFCKKNPEVMRHFCPATCKLDCTKR